MNNEYVIINKETIQKRIEELKNYFKEKQLSNIESVAYNHSILELKEILSQSTPLIPVVEKAFDAGQKHNKLFPFSCENKQDYITNLKLDI